MARLVNITKLFQSYFARHGLFVATHPWVTIALALLSAALSSCGLFLLTAEMSAIRLWIPEEADFATNYHYLWSTHPPELREHFLLFSVSDPDDNILRPEYLTEMYKIQHHIDSLILEDGSTWADYCFRVPSLSVSLTSLLGLKWRRRRRVDDGGFFDDLHGRPWSADPSVNFYPQPYCRSVESMDTTCLQWSIFELWATNGEYNDATESRVANTDADDILDVVNRHNFSGLYMIERPYQELLGGIDRDPESGEIKSAKAVMFKFYGKMNGTAAAQAKPSPDNTLGFYVDDDSLRIESALLRDLVNVKPSIDGLSVDVNVAKSFGDEASVAIFEDLANVMYSLMLLFAYVALMLGSLDLVGHRCWLTLAAVSSVLLSLPTTYGICSLFGLPFCPLHNFIPFLLMGIGMDDVFVVVQSFDNVSRESAHADKDLARRISVAAGEAGLAISVTTMTNVVAFIVGSMTILPALRSFCIFCGLGIFVVYCFQVTWFLAWFVIDQHRMEDGRNGFLPCIKHQTKRREDRLSQVAKVRSPYIGRAFEWTSAKLLASSLWQTVVVVVSLAMLAIAVWGNAVMVQKFDMNWFVPSDSYLASWFNVKAKYFTSHGVDVHIFMSELAFPHDLVAVKRAVASLKEADHIVKVDSFTEVMDEYYVHHLASDYGNATIEDLDADQLALVFTQFLFSPDGSRYRLMFQFDGPLQCGKPAPPLKVAVMKFRHRVFEYGRSADQIAAMNDVKARIDVANFTSTAHVFPFSEAYAAWETDEVVRFELYRNMLFAFICIGMAALVMINDLKLGVTLFCLVVMSVVEVSGFIHFVGLTIDTITSTNLIICVGICVDYASHIILAYQTNTVQTTNANRIIETMSKIGPAVLNGATTTVLSIIVLALSKSYVFATFFKIFIIGIGCSMFNSLLLLPIILNLMHWHDKSGQRHTSNTIKSDAAKCLPEARELMEIHPTDS